MALGRQVVGVIHGQDSEDADAPAVGLRADMDALPMEEQTNLAYASKHPNRMHACGHDGHTTMLLGAAEYLAKKRNFKAKSIVFFNQQKKVAMPVHGR